MSVVVVVVVVVVAAAAVDSVGHGVILFLVPSLNGGVGADTPFRPA